MSEYHKVGEVEAYLMTELDCGPNCWTGLLDLTCSCHMTSIQSNVVNLVTLTALL